MLRLLGMTFLAITLVCVVVSLAIAPFVWTGVAKIEWQKPTRTQGALTGRPLF